MGKTTEGKKKGRCRNNLTSRGKANSIMFPSRPENASRKKRGGGTNHLSELLRRAGNPRTRSVEPAAISGEGQLWRPKGPKAIRKKRKGRIFRKKGDDSPRVPEKSGSKNGSRGSHAR